MGAWLQAAASEQSLLDAWLAVRTAAAEDGVFDVDAELFDLTAASNITRLSVALRDGSWQPSPIRYLETTSPGAGRRRVTAVPALADAVVERSIGTVVERLVDPLLSPSSFAFRPGLGPEDAIRALGEARDLGLNRVVRCDISNPFAQIPRGDVARRLGEVCDDPELRTLVASLLDRWFDGRHAPRPGRGLGLPADSPLSPPLANLYLDAFDRAMTDAGCRLLRFGGEIAIPARDLAAAERALTLAIGAAASIALTIDLGTSDIASFDTGVEFLGRTVTSATDLDEEPSSNPLEGTVYVTQQGANLRSRGERMVVEQSDDAVLRINYARVRQVVVMGRVGMTTPFLQQALRRGIDVVLLSNDGGFAGRFVGPSGGTPTLRMSQYDLARQPEPALDVASRFVTGKIHNMRVMLQRVDRRQEERSLGAAIARMDVGRTNAGTAASVAELMGVEGAATRDYFQSWQEFLPSEWGFHGRVRRPPTDPVNAMLSFGYTLLAKEGEAAAEISGLDPQVGFLHNVQGGRPSLALDLIEEFRPVIVDQVVLSLVSRGAVTPADFTVDPVRGCRMGPTAREALLAAYERRMLQLVTHQVGRRMSYREAMHAQAKVLAAAVATRGDYSPMVWR